MTTHPADEYELEYGSAEELDVTDAETGLVRVCATECSTCILHPDKAKRLIQDEQSLQDFLANVVKEDSYVICHGTVPYLELGTGTPPAVCAGFMARHEDESEEVWRLSWRARMLKGLLRELPVPPPKPVPFPDDAAAA